MKRILVAVIIGLLLVGSVFAGGQKPKAATGEPVQVSFWVYSLSSHVKAWEPVVEQFNAEFPDINVKMENFPEYADKLSAAYATQTAPDIIMGDPTSFSDLNKNGLALAIDKTGVITEAEARKQFYGSLLDAFSYEGTLYSLPVESDPGSFTILYNVDMFKDAGVEAPAMYKSWQHWLDTAEKLTVREANGEVKVAGVNMKSHHGWDNFLHGIESFGGDYFDEKTGKFNVTDQIALNVIKAQHGPVLDKPMLDNPALPRMREALLQGHAAMMCDAPVIIALAKHEYPDLNIGVSVYPPIGNIKKSWSLISRGWGLGISIQSKKAAEAAKFLKFAFRDDVYIEFLKRYSGTSATMAADQHEYFQTGEGKIFKTLMSTAPDWVALPYIGNNSRYKNTYWQFSQQVSNGELTPEKALQELEKELNFISEETYR
jgi:multiple sugar transport system substrate-binding protein